MHCPVSQWTFDLIFKSKKTEFCILSSLIKSSNLWSSRHFKDVESSVQVEDSCQFSVCGPEYSSEFGVGRSPSVGSCSGECDHLAETLITNRFSREFLWSSCAKMCADKYSLALFRSVTGRDIVIRISSNGCLFFSLFVRKLKIFQFSLE